MRSKTISQLIKGALGKLLFVQRGFLFSQKVQARVFLACVGISLFLLQGSLAQERFDGTHFQENLPEDMPEESSPSSLSQPLEDFLGTHPEVDPNRPGHFMVVLFEGKHKPSLIKPVGISLEESPVYVPDGNQEIFDAKHFRWKGRGAIKRYNTEAWYQAFRKYSAPELSSRAFLDYALVGQRLSEGGPKYERLPLSQITILRLPQTWENIWQAWVLKAPVEERLQRVKEFDQFFQAEIKNPFASDEGFSPEEQVAYAQFYQEQFVFIRNERPQDPSIYWELAKYHAERDNVDAELSVYLDAIANEVEESESIQFHLKAGRIMVERLSLYREAIPHLDSARRYADAQLLLIECYHALKRYDHALQSANQLVVQIDQEGEESIPALLYFESPEEVKGKALLLQARAQIRKHRLQSAFKVLEHLDQSLPASFQAEKTLLLAAMLLYRNEPGDGQEVLRIIEEDSLLLPFLNQAKADRKSWSAPEYSPFGSQALSLWAQAQLFTTGKLAGRAQTEILKALEYAQILDPLAVEPFLVRAEVYQLLASEEQNDFERKKDWFRLARQTYLEGLAAFPEEARLNYELGSFEQRAGNFDLAENYLKRSLRSEPHFYPAMNCLGEIELSHAQEHRMDFLARLELGDPLGAAQAQNALNQSLRQGAAYYATSLEITPQQPVVQVALAGLYTQLGELSKEQDPSLSLNYLEKAREISAQEILRFEEGTTHSQASFVPSGEEVVLLPLEAFTIFAYASYELGKRRGVEAYIQEAQDALERFLVLAQDPEHHPDLQALSDFKNSEDWIWAQSALEQIKGYQRQRLQKDDFENRNIQGSLSLGNKWNIFHEVDEAFRRGIKVEAGKMVVEIDALQEEGFLSRVSRQESFSTLARFKARFASLGKVAFSRGIHFTRVELGDSAKDTELAWSIIVGFNSSNELFWDILRYSDEQKGEASSLLPGGRSIVVSPRFYGGEKLNPEQPVELELLRRVPVQNGSQVEYFLVVNGYELRLDISLVGEVQDGLDNPDFIEDAEDAALRIGFFVYGRKGTKGKLEVEASEWILDGNLAHRKE